MPVCRGCWACKSPGCLRVQKTFQEEGQRQAAYMITEVCAHADIHAHTLIHVYMSAYTLLHEPAHMSAIIVHMCGGFVYICVVCACIIVGLYVHMCGVYVCD